MFKPIFISSLTLFLFFQCATTPPIQRASISKGFGLSPSINLEKPRINYSNYFLNSQDFVNINWNNFTINPEWILFTGIKNRVEIQFSLTPLLAYWDISSGLKCRLFTSNFKHHFQYLNKSTFSLYSSAHGSIHPFESGPFVGRVSFGFLFSKICFKNIEILLNLLDTYYLWEQGTYYSTTDSITGWIQLRHIINSIDYKIGISYEVDDYLYFLTGFGYRYPYLSNSYLYKSPVPAYNKLFKSYLINNWEFNVSFILTFFSSKKELSDIINHISEGPNSNK